MKSSATLTVMTLVATGALGVAMMQGCTVTSTDPDTSSTSSSGSSGTSSGSSGNNEQDAAPEAAAPVCELNGKQETAYEPASCQTCMAGSCCAELKTCYDLPESETDFGCDQLYACVLECAAKPTEEEINACNDLCAEPPPEGIATPELVAAFNAIVECGRQHCNDTGCNFVGQ